MAIMRCTAVLSSRTGLIEDQVRNVWHFETLGDFFTEPHAVDIAESVMQFYRSLAQRLSPVIRRDPGSVAVEVARVEPGNPGESDDSVTKLIGRIVNGDTFGSTNTGIPLPSEAAVAMSFAGNLVGVPEESLGGLIRPAARRRGRLFLGPWNAGQVASDPSSGRPIVEATLRTAILTNYASLINSVNGAGQDAGKVRHVVYSRASGLVFPVQEVSVDDAFDTQRRRGEARVARQSAAVVQLAPTAF